MIRQLIRSYVVLVAGAVAMFTVPVAFSLTDQLRDDTAASVRREAETMALLLGNGNPRRARRCWRWPTRSRARRPARSR